MQRVVHCRDDGCQFATAAHHRRVCLALFALKDILRRAEGSLPQARLPRSLFAYHSHLCGDHPNKDIVQRNGLSAVDCQPQGDDLTVIGHEHAARTHIAMKHAQGRAIVVAELMRVRQTIQDLTQQVDLKCHVQRLRARRGAGGHLAERLTAQILGDQKVPVAILADLECLKDVPGFFFEGCQFRSSLLFPLNYFCLLTLSVWYTAEVITAYL